MQAECTGIMDPKVPDLFRGFVFLLGEKQQFLHLLLIFGINAL